MFPFYEPSAIICVGIISVMIFFLFLEGNITKTDVTIASAIVTDNPNQPASKMVFSADTETIYGIVYVEAKQSVPVKIRWYYLDGDILFHEDVRKIETKGEWFISPPQEGKFTPGKYRFEVLLVNTPIKVVDFEIK